MNFGKSVWEASVPQRRHHPCAGKAPLANKTFANALAILLLGNKSFKNGFATLLLVDGGVANVRVVVLLYVSCFKGNLDTRFGLTAGAVGNCFI